jgi:excisionase family DNA binding protein
MERLYYSTGQVARQLGVTLPTVRALCENHVIAAQTTPGGQWRVPAAEVERLKRDGLPPIPRPLPREPGLQINDEPFDDSAHSKFLPQSSEQVAAAVDQVAITKCALERRRVERDIEETEDWFRDRERQEAIARAADREKEQAKQAEQQRLEWIQQWIDYALNSLPYEARQEFEIEVHSMVQKTLSGVQANQPETITRRLVEAAVHRALAPWTRKQEINRALQASADGLPWHIRNCSEFAALKQLAWKAAALALDGTRDDASYTEMETAATQAVQPMIREYQHYQACQRIVESVYIPYVTATELDAAKEAVRQALALLPWRVSQTARPG